MLETLYFIGIALVVCILIGWIFGSYHYDTPFHRSQKDDL